MVLHSCSLEKAWNPFERELFSDPRFPSYVSFLKIHFFRLSVFRFAFWPLPFRTLFGNNLCWIQVSATCRSPLRARNQTQSFQLQSGLLSVLDVHVGVTRPFWTGLKKRGGITRLGGFKDYKEVLNTVIGRKTGGGKGATKVTAENTPESVDSDLAQLWSNAQRE